MANTFVAPALPACVGWCGWKNTVTHIGEKGYVYCAECAILRRQSQAERVRKMRAWELKLLAAGKPLPSYEPIRKPTATVEVSA